jgi:hypothetical protein
VAIEKVVILWFWSILREARPRRSGTGKNPLYIDMIDGGLYIDMIDGGLYIEMIDGGIG